MHQRIDPGPESIRILSRVWFLWRGLHDGRKLVAGCSWAAALAWGSGRLHPHHRGEVDLGVGIVEHDPQHTCVDLVGLLASLGMGVGGLVGHAAREGRWQLYFHCADRPCRGCCCGCPFGGIADSRRAPANGTFWRKALHAPREFQSGSVLSRLVMAWWVASQSMGRNVCWTKSTQKGFRFAPVTMAPAGGSPRVPRRS